MIDDYPVTCSCGFFGMRLECPQGRCLWCGERVRREKEGENGQIRSNQENF